VVEVDTGVDEEAAVVVDPDMAEMVTHRADIGAGPPWAETKAGKSRV